MSQDRPKDPLHGLTLEALLNQLVERYGWPRLAEIININCFKNEPSIKSSLKFLRRTPWARKQVETLYLNTIAGSPTSSQPPSDNPWLSGSKRG